MGVVMGCIVPHPPIIIPEIGGGREEEAISTIKAMWKLKDIVGAKKPELFFIISYHYEAMGVAKARKLKGSMRSWGAMGVEMEFDNDLEAVRILEEECERAGIPIKSIGDRSYDLDHGVMVPMYFLAEALKGIPMVPLTFSWLPLKSHFEFGRAIRRASERLDKRVLVVASGDLSHRLTPGAPAGFDPLGKVFDKKLVDALKELDIKEILDMDPDLIERAGECGLRSIVILLGAIEGLPLKHEILSYEGPFGVGYLVAYFDVQNPHPVVELARKAVEKYVREGKIIKPENLTDEMKERAGVFVSIKKKGELRGCIGTFEPTRKNVAEEIIYNAISSATRDPRFPPVTEDELPELEYSVDILSKPEPASIDELDPKKYGIIVESGVKRALLLPDLEGVETVEQQIDICRMKAGISPDEPIKIYKFEVRRYK